MCIHLHIRRSTVGPVIYSHSRSPTTIAQTSAYPPTASGAPSRHLGLSDICANPRRTAEESLRPKATARQGRTTASIHRLHVAADRRVLMWTTTAFTAAWKSRIHTFASAHGHSPDDHFNFDTIDE
ncbi:hypothetical protein B0H14DRAFT_3535553 [Mycena olivaceomarginata]|nr:hypothetical protein B0H14DRAFT_3535553 [Mycena olivaceomarginata]